MDQVFTVFLGKNSCSPFLFFSFLFFSFFLLFLSSLSSEEFSLCFQITLGRVRSCCFASGCSILFTWCTKRSRWTCQKPASAWHSRSGKTSCTWKLSWLKTESTRDCTFWASCALRTPFISQPFSPARSWITAGIKMRDTRMTSKSKNLFLLPFSLQINRCPSVSSQHLEPAHICSERNSRQGYWGLGKLISVGYWPANQGLPAEEKGPRETAHRPGFGPLNFLSNCPLHISSNFLIFVII